MKLKAYIVWLFGLLLFPAALTAQQDLGNRHSLTLHYGINMPVGNNFISKSSFFAPSLSYHYRTSRLLEHGLSFGFSGSSERSNDQIHFDNDLISGESERKLSLFSIEGEQRYYPFGKKRFTLQPYLAVGIGWQYAKFRITGESIETSGANNGAFMVTPQLGFRANPWEGRFFLDARVMWRYAQNGWQKAYTTSQQGIGVQLGIGMHF